MKKLDDLIYRPTEEEQKELGIILTPTDLAGTVEMMTSNDYKLRFRSEYFQEKIRAEKLEKFILKIEVGMEKDAKTCPSELLVSNQPKHDCPIELLQEQLYIMKEKLRIFKKRAIYENIELD